MIRAARLVRVSSGKQAKDDRTSLPYQRKALTEICQKSGWVSLEEDLYVEVISGAKGRENRETLDALLEEIKRGRYQRLCVLDFDRSTRKGLGEWEEIKDILRDGDCKIVINGTVYDVEDEDQEFQTDIQAVVAKRERQMIRKRIIRGLEVTAAEGKNTGGRVPYGYHSYYPETRDGKKPRVVIEIVPEHAEAVRLAFELYATGVKSYFDVADELNAMGYRYHKGVVFNWQASYYILRNPSYAGLAVRRRDYTKRHHATKLPQVITTSKAYPPIISLDLWERVQAIRDAKPKYRQQNNPRRHPLAGVLRCQGCGGSMVIRRDYSYRADGSKLPIHQYACFQHLKRITPCPNPQVIRYEMAHLAAIEALKIVSQGLPIEDDAPDVGSASAQLDLKAKLMQLDQEEMDLLSRLNKPVEEGGIREDQFRRYNQMLLNRRDEFERELQALQKRKRPKAFAIPQAEVILEELDIDDPRLNDLVRSTFSELVMVATGEKVLIKKWAKRMPFKVHRVQRATLLSGLELSF